LREAQFFLEEPCGTRKGCVVKQMQILTTPVPKELAKKVSSLAKSHNLTVRGFQCLLMQRGVNRIENGEDVIEPVAISESREGAKPMPSKRKTSR
jgi:hypothetical protein